MMIRSSSILFLLIKLTFSKISITNYPTIELLENRPLNTLVVSLSRFTNFTNSTKLVLLNLNGFETNLFAIINGSIYTIHSIDREEFLEKQYCLDNLYCKIEIHILVNDGNGYWIIPVHILDENDNEPKFRENQIELKYRENVLHGYQIPFEGAKDLDEGKNSEIEYILDCSNNFPFNLNQTTKTCYSLFELIILSRSIANYDRLALKFLPSSSAVSIENEYKLKVYAFDKRKKNIKHDASVLNLNIHIEQKERITKFSLLNYEFVVLLNSSLTSKTDKSSIKIGRVYAIPNNSFERIYYQLIQKTHNEIEINSLTGELNYIFKPNFFRNPAMRRNEIEFDVQASILKRNSSKMLLTQTKVKVFFRYFDQLNNISFQFQIHPEKQNEIVQINNSNCFFVDKNIQINENLFDILLHSFFYPMDQLILSLQNYFNVFSLAASSSPNSFALKSKQQLHSTSIYMLNISVKHKLTQQWLPNLTIELIVIDQWTTTTMKSDTIATTVETRRSTVIQTQSIEFCQKNQNYILYKINKKKRKKVGFLKVIKSNIFFKKNRRNNFLLSINQSEIIIDGCRMSWDQLNQTNSLNKSSSYQLCLLSYSNQCYNLTIKDDIFLRTTDHDNQRWILSMKLVELIMLIVSLIFILITIILILLICRLKEIDICLKWKNSLIYRNKYGLTNVQQQFSSSSTKIKERVHSIVSGDSRSPSFQSIRISIRNTGQGLNSKLNLLENDPFGCHIDDFDQQEALPSNMFVLSSSIRQSFAPSLTYSFQQQEILQPNSQGPETTPQRTSSSSSFLQETKQLLDMISTTNHQHFDLSKLTSEV